MNRNVSETQFHADQVDQMDLALDQLALKDRNYDRFALLLVDNVMELALHHFAQSKSARRQPNEPEPRKEVRDALGSHFDKKVALARRERLLADPEADSAAHLHDFRNRAHHAGVRHEGILHSVSLLYFKLATSTMAALAGSTGWSDGSSTTYSHRAMKYLGESSGCPGNQAKVQQAWQRFAEIADAMNDTLIADLHNDLKAMVDAADDDITFLAEKGWQKRTRRDAVVDAQLHRVWATPEAGAFLGERLAGRENLTVADHMNCLRDEWAWPTKVDPVPGWRGNLGSLGAEKSNHAALKKYCDFVLRNEAIVEELAWASGDLDEGLEREAEAAREEGRL